MATREALADIVDIDLVAFPQLAQGCSGDLVLAEAETVAEAVAQRPGRRTVVKRGRIVARDGVTLP